MAFQHAINGTNVNYVTTPQWIDEPAGGDFFNGKSSHNRWRLHRWESNIMTAAEFNTIYALEGTQVTITTTDYDSRNGDYVTYYVAELKSVSGRHEGPNMASVRADFLVRV